MLKFLAGDVEAADIHQTQVIVCTAGYQTKSLLYQFLCQDTGVFHYLLSVELKLRL